MMSTVKRVENAKLSQRLSTRPEVVSVSPRGVNPPSPFPPPRENSFFSERTLTFLGIIASIISLSLALWSIHRGSDLSKRISDLNLSVVDLIVESKKNPVTEQSHTRTSKTIRDKLDEKRSKRMDKTHKLDTVFQQEMDRSSKIKTEHDRYIATVSKNYMESQMKMDADNKVLLDQTRLQIDEMKRKREVEAAMRARTNVMDSIKQPNPMEVMGKPLGKIMDITQQLGEKFSESKDMTRKHLQQRDGHSSGGRPSFPIMETRVEDDIDLEDLEKDLKMFSSGQ
jgi:hypothetical protein